MPVIALHGLKGVGKDTVGRHLVEHHGYTSIAMAAKLKTLLEAMDPVVLIKGKPYGLNHVLNFRCTGWDEAKREHAAVRNLMRDTAESMKTVFGEDIWVREVLRSLSTLRQEDWTVLHRLVITDMRFPIELTRLREAFTDDLITIKITRDGHDDGHVSESGLPDSAFDFCIANNKSVFDLHDAVDEIVETLRDGY